MSQSTDLSRYQPYLLAALRVVAGGCCGFKYQQQARRRRPLEIGDGVDRKFGMGQRIAWPLQLQFQMGEIGEELSAQQCVTICEAWI